MACSGALCRRHAPWGNHTARETSAHQAGHESGGRVWVSTLSCAWVRLPTQGLVCVGRGMWTAEASLLSLLYL